MEESDRCQAIYSPSCVSDGFLITVSVGSVSIGDPADRGLEWLLGGKEVDRQLVVSVNRGLSLSLLGTQKVPEG